ncbi:MAG TPA: hypothetical protein VGM90_03910 [Kofleriaceae bacterium]|jgi:hypothetical protein
MNRVLLVALLLASTSAAADTVGANPGDSGKVTFVAQGVKEIDVGGIFVLSSSKAGDSDAQTRVSTLGGLGFQYFLKDNLSIGGQFLANYDRQSATTYATAFGGAAFASLHVRLGLGAFLRPTLGLGALFGTQKTELTPGQLLSANQVSGLIRIALPFAYFPGSRVVLQAGPELDISIGNVTPEGGESQSFTNITGGFGISAGYVF